MKVLFVSAWYSPHSIGGAERVVRTLADGLQAAGHKAVVLTTSFQGDAAERDVDGVRVRSLPVKNLYGFDDFSSRKLKSVWHALDSHNPLMRASVERVIREERPDVIHTHVVTGFSPSAWSVAAHCGVPIVHTLHDHYVICARSAMAIEGVWCRQQHLECALLSIPRKAATRHVNVVVGVSDYVLRRHQEFGAFVETKSLVINNPCHLVGIAPTRGPELSNTPRSFRLGFMGRLERNKGIELLLEALRGVYADNWTLQVAGDGTPDLVRQLKATYGSDPRVSFVGSVDPARFLSQVDVLVVPSLFPETFGLSAAEALAMGVPVVASTRGALPELVKDGVNGFLFDPDDPRALSELLMRIATGRSSIANAAAVCPASVARLHPDLVVARHLELYASVTGSG